MSCNPLLHPTCFFSPLSGPITSSLIDGLDHSLGGGIRWIVVHTTTWWVQIPSPNLAAEPAVARIQAWLLPVTIAVAIGGIIAGGLRMAITRRANPMLDVGGGLLTMAAAVTVGAIIPVLLLRAGDEWSTWVLRISSGGHFDQRLEALLNFDGKAAPAVVLALSLAALIMALIQAVLMLFRQVSLFILAGVLPLAAAGAAAPLTKPWIRKVSSWMLALIFYKPAAAAVYATAFTMVGSGHSATTILLGFVTLVLSVFMLPALMKFFTWTTGSIANGGGGGGGLLSTAAVGAVAVGALRSGANGAGSAAMDQASYLNSRLGPSPSGSSPPGDDSASPPTPATPVPSTASTAASASGPSGGMTTTASFTSPTPAGATATAAPAASATGATTAATTGAAEAGAAASGAAATAATGAAAAAGPVGIAVAGAVQTGQAAVKTTTRLAKGAMEPDEENAQ
ncbi:MAG TPA: hypothetical protein VFI65_19135 [Streptosporangiaceae bacterium]|nr:hypothetical protein [Streptosporangiaceae bacterium]